MTQYVVIDAGLEGPPAANGFNGYVVDAVNARKAIEAYLEYAAEHRHIGEGVRAVSVTEVPAETEMWEVEEQSKWKIQKA